MLTREYLPYQRAYGVSGEYCVNAGYSGREWFKGMSCTRPFNPEMGQCHREDGSTPAALVNQISLVPACYLLPHEP
jgi:hypothetical protein